MIKRACPPSQPPLIGSSTGTSKKLLDLAEKRFRSTETTLTNCTIFSSIRKDAMESPYGIRYFELQDLSQ